VQSKFKITLLFASALVTAHAQFHHNADAQKKSDEVEQQAAKTAEEINKYEIQLDKTERALSSVAQATDGTELKKRYAYFSKEVDTLGKAQEHAKSAIRQMNSKISGYRASWDKSVSQIQDEDLKQASIERKSKMNDEYDSILAKLTDIDVQLQPFMTGLRDLEAFLGADLRLANVNNANGKIEQSNEAARDLRDRIGEVQTALRDFLKQTSP
jgi:uncharacterized coiled-coil DUF342 family protein